MKRRPKLVRKLQDLQLMLVNDNHGLCLSVDLSDSFIYISLHLSGYVKSRFVYKDTTDDEFSAIVNEFSNTIASQIAKNVYLCDV